MASNNAQNSILFSGELHAFDVKIAEIYGIEEAIVLHHFQFWIKFNKRLSRNFKEGRTWTYQTQDELVAHFPYFKNRQKLIRIIESLVKMKVLKKGNFNKMKFDRTVWYAFEEEEKWLTGTVEDPAISKNVQSIVRKCTMDSLDSDNGEFENGQPIPDDKKDNKKRVNSLVPTQSEDVPSSTFNSEDKKKALEMCEYLLTLLRKYFPKTKQPNLNKWSVEMDRLHRLDGRSYEEIKKMIDWALEDSFWCAQIHSADALRRHWDKMWAKMNPPNNKSNMEITNRAVAKEVKDALGEKDPNFWMSAKEVGHRGLREAIPIAMNPEEFKRTLMKWFNLREK